MVVKDEFSDTNHRSPASADGLGRDSDDELLRPPARNLTQELAQLLAASIAQNQTKPGRSEIPTNAELINLANLVLAAATQRTPEPAFKSGLLSLSDVQARPVSGQQQSAAFSPLDLGQDDQAMLIPSTRPQPSPFEDDHSVLQKVGSAVVGLIAGLMIVVPTVLWLSGFFGPQWSTSIAARTPTPRIDNNSSADSKAADVRTATVQARPVDQYPTSEKHSDSAPQFVARTLEPSQAAPLEIKPTLPPVVLEIPAARLTDPNKAHIDELLAQATQRIESGDVIGAREMLAGADDGTQGAISFALAETYDPNMLAAWGIRGSVADAAKARALYQKASDLGVARAQDRLDALQ